MLEKIRFHYTNYKLLKQLQEIHLFKLAIYHKFVSNNPAFQSWADRAFFDYLAILQDNPPDPDLINDIQKMLDRYEFI